MCTAEWYVHMCWWCTVVFRGVHSYSVSWRREQGDQRGELPSHKASTNCNEHTRMECLIKWEWWWCCVVLTVKEGRKDFSSWRKEQVDQRGGCYNIGMECLIQVRMITSVYVCDYVCIKAQSRWHHVTVSTVMSCVSHWLWSWVRSLCLFIYVESKDSRV